MEKESTSDDYDPSEEDLSGPTVDRRTAMHVLSAAGLAGLAGCTGTSPQSSGGSESGGSTTSSDTGGSEKSGGRLTIGLGRQETGRLEFGYVGSIDLIRILTNASNGLVKLNPDLTISGDIAKDWTVENGGSRYVFDLREGVKFHNGDEVTAQDFEYTIKRNLDKGYETALSQLDGFLAPPDDGGVVVRDDYTLELNWLEPVSFALATLTRGGYPAANVVSKRAVEEMGEDEFGLNPVGTGPFEIVEHSVDSSITLDRFDDYFGTDDEGNQLPYMDGIDVQLIPEQSSLGNALTTGEVDFLIGAGAEILRSFEQNDELTVKTKPDLMFRAAGFNQDNEPLQKEEFRMAVAKGIDNEALIEKVFDGTGVTAYGPYSPAFGWLQRDDTPSAQNYDPEGAEALLEEIDAKGTTITWTCYPSKQRMGRVLRQQLKEIGITVEVNALPPSQYGTALENGDWDIQPLATYGETDPGMFLRKVFTPDGAWSYHSTYDNDDVTELIEEQSSMTDTEERKEALWEIEDSLHNTAAAAFITHRYDIAPHHEKVQDFQIWGSNRYMDQVWIQD